MLHISIPGYQDFDLEHLVLDYNGTLAVDGVPLPGVLQHLSRLSETFSVHVLTADTFGKVRECIRVSEVAVHVIQKEHQTEQKRDFILELGAERTVAIGNGYIDYLMLQEAALGLAVIQAEGSSFATLSQADAIFTNILDVFEALLSPQRLVATLRR